MSFEQAMQRLEEIITLLSKNTVTLDESLELYSEGAKLAELCTKQLDEAQLRLKTLSQRNELHESL